MPGCGGPYPAIEGQQDRVALDVPVDDTLGMQVSQGLQHGLTHSGDLFLVQPGQGGQGHRWKRMLAVAGLQGRWAGRGGAPGTGLRKPWAMCTGAQSRQSPGGNGGHLVLPLP